MNEADLKWARCEPSAFGDQLLNCRCGCFYCRAIVTAAEIEHWVDVDPVAGFGLTPLCPRCEIDSVIEETESRMITVELLTAMHASRF